ncbi:MAG: isoprenyl transferase, partial [Gemmatimonadetes bacterium]
MDGNGRWGRREGCSRSAGHRAGARAVDAVVRAAVRHGVDVLTLFAFSSDNWNRPAHEVRALMRLLTGYLRARAHQAREAGVRV